MTMNIYSIFESGSTFANTDDITREMLADFKHHKVGMELDSEALTIVIKEGIISLDNGIADDCDVVLQLERLVICDAIDNTIDLMEIKDRGKLVKGGVTDPHVPVHLMATFPLFDAMVRLYESDETFKKQVDDLKNSLQ